MGGKRSSLFGNKLRKKIGLAGGNQFLDLLFGNFAMQNVFTDTESAGLLLRDGVFARIRAIQNVNLTFLANWAESERFVFLGVDRYRLIVAVLAKVERRFEFLAQLNDRIELAPDFAAESFKRTDLAFGKQFFQF